MSQVKPFVAVVDDDESVSRAIKRLLRSTGFSADTFKTGNDFLDMFDSIPSYRPACIVLDVQMPGLNGLEVQQRLAGSGIPIIFITAHDDAVVREVYEEAGIRARVVNVLGVRHSLGEPGANVYVIFRLTPDEGEPHHAPVLGQRLAGQAERDGQLLELIRAVSELR